MGRKTQFKWPINKKPIKPAVALSNEQKETIRQLASPSVTIAKIAEKVKAQYHNVYWFVVKENLPAKMDGNAVKRKEEKHPKPSGVFFVHEQNWI